MSTKLPTSSPKLCRGAHAQAGVVLILALIMLVVISMLTAIGVRNATSSEGVNANVRQTQLASQSAETALRYCEEAVINLVSLGTGTFFIASPPTAATVTLSATHIHDLVSGTRTSMVADNWDSNASGNKILLLPLSSVNHAGITTTFSRPPECMVERLSPATSINTYSKNFIITARGFGPEVSAADASRNRPIGSEVWMQSSLEFN